MASAWPDLARGLSAWAAGLEASAVGEWMRGSDWAYPVVNLLHLLGLARALLAEQTRLLAQALGRAAEDACRFQGFADHLAQAAGEAVEMPGQLAQLIAAVGLQLAGQVGLATGDVGHGPHGIAQRSRNAAGNQGDDAGDDPTHRTGQPPRHRKWKHP